MAPAIKKEEKKTAKDGRLKMEETVVTKVIREVKQKGGEGPQNDRGGTNCIVAGY